MAPAFAEVASSVCTTVAMANCLGHALSAVTASNSRSVVSTAGPSSGSSLARLARLGAGANRSRWGKGCRHPGGGARLVAGPAQHRVEPDHSARTTAVRRQLPAQRRRRTGVETVAHDDHGRAPVDGLLGEVTIEGGETLADPRAAMPALRDQRHALDGAPRLPLAQDRADMDQAGVEDDGFGASARAEQAPEEAHVQGTVLAHRARGVERPDQPRRVPMPAPIAVTAPASSRLRRRRSACSRARASVRLTNAPLYGDHDRQKHDQGVVEDRHQRRTSWTAVLRDCSVGL